MATSASRAVNAWYRDYCRDIFAAIGRNDLRSQVNAPINTDIQMVSATEQIRIAEQTIINEWVPAMEPFWSIAQDSHDADFRPVTPRDGGAPGLVPDATWDDYLLLLQDDDLAKRYFKTLRRLTIRAEQSALYEASL